MLLSSHILSEVEALCDRVSIIRAGEVVETGTLAELRHLTRTAIDAETRQPIRPRLSTAPGVHDLLVDGPRVRFDVDTADLDAVMRILTDGGLLSLSASPPTLEELFLRHYGEKVDRTPDVDRHRAPHRRAVRPSARKVVRDDRRSTVPAGAPVSAVPAATAVNWSGSGR